MDDQPPETDSADLRQDTDPTYRIGRLRAARQEVVSVPFDADLSLAISEMMAHDFSQLAVISGPRQVRGVISWKTIARKMAMDRDVMKVKDCVERPNEVGPDYSLLNAIPVIYEHDYVLVKSPDGRVSGIVTAADLSLEFQKLTEPFLLLGEIERHVRKIIEGKIPEESIKDVAKRSGMPAPSGRIELLTLGDLVRLIEEPENWNLLALRNIDRKVFVRDLEKIRVVRNKVMHFNVDDITLKETALLKRFVNFVRTIDNIRPGDR